MGSALGSSTFAIIATISLVIAAILLIFADSSVKGITGYDSNDNLQVAHTDLVYAQIFAWFAAVFSFVLFLGYILVHAEWLQNEWLHLILILLAIGVAIASIVYMSFAMSKVRLVDNDNNTELYLWISIILATFGILIIALMGVWRLYHKTKYDTVAGKTGKETEKVGKTTKTTRITTEDQYGYPIQSRTVMEDDYGTPPPSMQQHTPEYPPFDDTVI